MSNDQLLLQFRKTAVFHSGLSRGIGMEKCFFGEKCYRKNPQHFRDFRHEHLNALLDEYGNGIPPRGRLEGEFEVGADVILEQLKIYREVNGREPPKKKAKRTDFEAKLASQSPYNVFLTKVEQSRSTHKAEDSLYLTDLLHPSLGDLKCSLQVNFMVEWEWLKMNYEVTKNAEKPLLIIHGQENEELRPKNLPKNVSARLVKSKFPFGTHHTKLMVFVYEDGSTRVVVSTANLVASDWTNRTQALWVSPKLRPAPNDDNPDSETGFRANLVKYLRFYNIGLIDEYIRSLERCDFSAVNAFFVSSVPDSHKAGEMNGWGHRQVASILRKHLSLGEERRWPLVMQCSSIGSLGANADVWLKGDLGRSLAATSDDNKVGEKKCPEVKFIYPSKRDVFGSYDGVFGGGCLPYSEKTHWKQPWLQELLHSWRSDSRDRSRAMPHVKSYARIEAGNEKAAYLLVTSANVSKAAWGTLNKQGDSFQIQSYEAGVLLLPKFVLSPEKEHFDLKAVKLPFDVPLTRYADDETPWFMDYLRQAVSDHH